MGGYNAGVLLRLDNVSRSIGARLLFRDVSIHVSAGDRIGLVGPNGAGKTTLLRMIAGEDAPDSGRIMIPRSSRIGLLRQEVDPSGNHSAREEASTALAALDALEAELRALEGRMEECGREGIEIPHDVAERYDACHSAFEFGGGFEREARVERVLDGLGFDTRKRAQPMSALSGGWLVRVELAKLLLSAPDVLLLDEPTNHLDLPSIEWFDETLASFGGAAILVSHDRALLRRHATTLAELELARFTLYKGRYDAYIADKEQRRIELEARKKSQDKEIAQTEKFIARFRAKASKARQVQSRIKELEKTERVELAQAPSRKMRLRIPEPRRAGEDVIRLGDIHKSYDDNAVYAGVDFLLRRGERAALAGPNGAGKSTLLRIIAGVLPFDSGERVLGHNVEVAFFAQHQLEALNPALSVIQELETAATSDDIPRLRGHLGAFLFSGDDIDKQVGVLSGGEKSRLALAKLLLRPSNFLVLDEPTNHLDIAACEVLEDVLKSYTGSLLFISHDRAFINAIANRIVEVQSGELRDFRGNYDAYLRELSGAAKSGVPELTQSAQPDPSPKETKRERMASREQEKTRSRKKSQLKKRIAALEAEIGNAEGKQQELGLRLGDPELFRDGDRVREIEAERTQLQAEIDSLYKEWERLAAELEALGGDA